MVQAPMVVRAHSTNFLLFSALGSGILLSLFFVPQSAFASTTYGYSTYGSGSYGGAGGDTTPPVISAIATSTTSTTATITWTTDEGASDVLNYGLTSSYGLSSSTAATSTSHSITLTGLTALTTYHFQIQSTDDSSNAATSSDQTFTTQATPDITAPTVTVTVPSNGATIAGGSVTLTATSNDNVAVTSVQFYIDAIATGSPGTGSPYSIVFNSTSVSSGAHTISAVAKDAANNAATSTISVTIDNTAPTISSVASSTSSTAATITWTTDENATSVLNYGLTTGYGTASTSSTLTTSHSLSLTGLTPSTLYHFALTSVDASSNSTTSSDYTFTTSATPDTTAPTISSVASSTSSTAATITWTTNENATSVLNYGLTTGYGTASTSSTLTTSHSLSLTGLTPSTLYHFALTSVDASSNSTTSSDYTFRTVADVTAPVISSISANPSTTSVVVTWTTDENATSQVVYSTDLSYTSATTLNGTLQTSHSESFTGLSENTTYHFLVISTDASNNTSTSSDQSVTTTQTSSGGGGGGGHSSGGGGSTTIFTPPVTVVTTFIFTRDLPLASENADVKALQTILIAKGFLAPQYATGYFGGLTKQALSLFQSSVGITPAVGYFGPVTRAYLNSHVLGAPTITPSVPVTVPFPPAPTYTPTYSASPGTLTIGSTGSSVTALQQFLKNYPAFYPTGLVTGYYGSLTRDAVGAFQLHYVIVATPNEEGYGIVGPRTRAKISELTL